MSKLYKKEKKNMTNDKDLENAVRLADYDKRYFDFNKKKLSEIQLKEQNDKASCYISEKGGYYKGFKLTNRAEVNIYCEFSFFPSSKTGKYIPRPTFFKLNKNFTEKEQKIKEKVRIELTGSEEADNFWKIIGFLYSYKELVDLGEFEESYSVIESNKYLVEFETKGLADKIKDLKNFLNNLK